MDEFRGNFRSLLRYTGVVLLVVIQSGCGLLEETADEEQASWSNYSFYHHAITDSLDNDPVLEALIFPYQRYIQEKRSRVLSRSVFRLEPGKPESALGNMIADLVRSRASSETGRRIDLAVLASEEFRIYLPKGDITLGMIHDLIPSDEKLNLQKHTGKQIRKLANEIAAKGGVPISGLRMQISDGLATGVVIGSDQIKPDQTYWLVTCGRLADSESSLFNSLNTPIKNKKLEVSVREAIIDYLRARETIAPVTDHRIRIVR